ncbi:MAG TPA: alcohol dehydrogenase [Bacteroidetes bacterium]|nr:alcohol dehydrogenase [Bacteroidota bacterium]
MKAVIQEKPGDKLYVKDIPIPEPGKGEVLVKMNYAPVNPSDLSLLQGTYAGSHNYPLIPGIEGSGQVVKSGKGIIARSREGKRVACTASGQSYGTWAEYMVTSALRTIPLDKHIDDEQGSMLLVNPLTAVAFIEIARKDKKTALVNNAAASSLGKMLISLCRENNIGLINIVARESQYQYLKELGADYVLNSSSPDFENELARHSDLLGARLFFDAVGGKQAETMLKASPPGSTIITYAKLSERNIRVDPRLLLQQGKKITGFYLANYISGKSILQKLRATGKAKKLLSENITIKVSARYPLEKINEALEYYRNNMSSGKVLLYP